MGVMIALLLVGAAASMRPTAAMAMVAARNEVYFMVGCWWLSAKCVVSGWWDGDGMVGVGSE